MSKSNVFPKERPVLSQILNLIKLYQKYLIGCQYKSELFVLCHSLREVDWTISFIFFGQPIKGLNIRNLKIIDNTTITLVDFYQVWAAIVKMEAKRKRVQGAYFNGCF